MLNNKLVVSFDPDTYVDATTSTRIWNYFEFREFIKQLMLKTDQIDLYMITTSTDSSFIDTVRLDLGIDSAKVIQVGSISTKISKITQYAIDVHFDGDQLTTESVGTLTTAKPIVVNFIQVGYPRESYWLTRFKFWYHQITGKQVILT